MGHPRPLFCLFSFFSNNLQDKTLDFSVIRTWVVRVEGEHYDHLTTTISQLLYIFSFKLFLWYLKVDKRRYDSEAVIADGFRVRTFDELDLLGVHVVVQRLHALEDVLGVSVLGVVEQNAHLSDT